MGSFQYFRVEDGKVKINSINEGRDTVLYNAMRDLYREDREQVWFHWPTEFKVVTQAFGINAAYYGQFGLPGHEGIDMRAYEGTPIRSCWSGTVIRNNFHTAYGNHIRIEQDVAGETLEFVYAHFVEATHLKLGAVVKKGDIIGKAGSTGNSSASHLHFSLKSRGATEAKLTDYPWDIIDPTPFFKELL